MNFHLKIDTLWKIYSDAVFGKEILAIERLFLFLAYQGRPYEIVSSDFL